MSLRESEYFVAWLIFWLGAALGGLAAGAIGGAAVGLFLGVAGVDLALVRIICGGVGLVLGAIVSYLLFRLIVGGMLVSKAEARACTDTQVVQTSFSQTSSGTSQREAPISNQWHLQSQALVRRNPTLPIFTKSARKICEIATV